MPGARNLRIVVTKLRAPGMIYFRMPVFCWTAQFEDRGHEIDAGQQGTDARDLQWPEVVIDADIGRKGELGERRIAHPAGAREIADDERYIDQERARCSEPETDRVEHGKGDVAHTKLQWH